VGNDSDLRRAVTRRRGARFLVALLLLAFGLSDGSTSAAMSPAVLVAAPATMDDAPALLAEPSTPSRRRSQAASVLRRRARRAAAAAADRFAGLVRPARPRWADLLRRVGAPPPRRRGPPLLAV
jgi:hypothetical protein